METDWLDKYINDEEYKSIKEYLQVFDRYCYNSPFIGLLTLLLILGQLFKDKKIPKGGGFFDLRIHILLIQPSGSGKSEALNFVTLLAKRLGLKVITSTDYTDAGLIGGLESSRKNKEDTLIKKIGVLEYADILSMDEASVLFKDNNPFATNARVYLQQAMNNYQSGANLIVKLMRDGVLEFHPHASIWLTTVMPHRFDDVLDSGLLQRMLISIEEEDIEKRKANSKEDIKRVNFNSTYASQENSEETLRLITLAEKLNKIKTYYDTFAIKITDDSEDLFTLSSDEMFELTKTIPDPIRRNQIVTFATRSMTMIYKISYLLATTRNEGKIAEKDIRFAKDIVTHCFENMILYLEEKPTAIISMREQNSNRIFQTIKKTREAGIKADDLDYEVTKKLKLCSTTTLYKILGQLIKQKMIKKEQVVEEGHAFKYYFALESKAGLKKV